MISHKHVKKGKRVFANMLLIGSYSGNGFAIKDDKVKTNVFCKSAVNRKLFGEEFAKKKRRILSYVLRTLSSTTKP